MLDSGYLVLQARSSQLSVLGTAGGSPSRKRVRRERGMYYETYCTNLLYFSPSCVSPVPAQCTGCSLPKRSTLTTNGEARTFTGGFLLSGVCGMNKTGLRCIGCWILPPNCSMSHPCYCKYWHRQSKRIGAIPLLPLSTVSVYWGLLLWAVQGSCLKQAPVFRGLRQPLCWVSRSRDLFRRAFLGLTRFELGDIHVKAAYWRGLVSSDKFGQNLTGLWYLTAQKSS